jgi:molybdopterin synthase catalytic subunit
MIDFHVIEELDMIIVTKNPVDPNASYERIRKSDGGSVLLHYAVVKSQAGDRISAGIHFEKTGDMEEEFAEISADIKQRWAVEDILLLRRIGTLDIGDIISVVAVSSSSSEDPEPTPFSSSLFHSAPALTGPPV